MSLTDKNLELEREHLDGKQRLYKWGGNGYGASAVNAPMPHSYPFAWEIAIIKDGALCYTTPLTSDVAAFDTDEEANAFLERAFAELA